MRNRILVLTVFVSVVVFSATGAWAQTTVDPRIEHEAKRKWFFWPNIAFGAAILGIAALLGAIYFVKVIRPRLRRGTSGTS